MRSSFSFSMKFSSINEASESRFKSSVLSSSYVFLVNKAVTTTRGLSLLKVEVQIV